MFAVRRPEAHGIAFLTLVAVWISLDASPAHVTVGHSMQLSLDVFDCDHRGEHSPSRFLKELPVPWIISMQPVLPAGMFSTSAIWPQNLRRLFGHQTSDIQPS